MPKHTVTLNRNNYGSQFADLEVGETELSLEILVDKSSIANLNTARHEIAALLYATTPKKIILDDETGVYYMGILNGSFPFNQILAWGKAILNFVCPDPQCYGINATTVNSITPFTAITGTNAGKVPSKGVINAVIASTPATFKVSLNGTLGVVALVPPTGQDLDGTWIINLDTRNVYKDSVIANEYIDFVNTEFPAFIVPIGAYTITFDSAVTSGSYVYNAAFL